MNLIPSSPVLAYTPAVKRTIIKTTCGLALLVAASLTFGAEPRVFVITRPTIVAFFPPIDSSSIDADTNEALSDFQWYAMEARKRFRNTVIDFQEIYAQSFRVRVGNKTTTFRPGKVKIGYYFIAPGKKPRVEYGVMTDADLLHVANEYFDTTAGEVRTHPSVSPQRVAPPLSLGF